MSKKPPGSHTPSIIGEGGGHSILTNRHKATEKTVTNVQTAISIHSLGTPKEQPQPPFRKHKSSDRCWEENYNCLVLFSSYLPCSRAAQISRKANNVSLLVFHAFSLDFHHNPCSNFSRVSPHIVQRDNSQRPTPAIPLPFFPIPHPRQKPINNALRYMEKPLEKILSMVLEFNQTSRAIL